MNVRCRQALAPAAAAVLWLGTVSGFSWWASEAPGGLNGAILLWPGLTLARYGVPHGWVIMLLLLGLLPVLLYRGLRVRPLLAVLVAGAAIPVLLAASGLVWVRILPAPPLPSSPYAQVPEQLAAFDSTFRQGYMCGLIGISRTYCFAPEPETDGFYSGLCRGLADWYRFRGKRIPETIRKRIQGPAGLDGVGVGASNPR